MKSCENCVYVGKSLKRGIYCKLTNTKRSADDCNDYEFDEKNQSKHDLIYKMYVERNKKLRDPENKRLDYKFTIIFFLLGGGAFILGFLIKTDFNVPFYMAFKFLTLPLFIFSYLFISRHPYIFFERAAAWKSIPLSVVLAGTLTLFSAPYLSFINAVLPPQEIVTIKREVIRKYTAGKHGDTKVIELDTRNRFFDHYNFYVSEKQYNEISIGDSVERKMKIGGLGIAYDWIF